MSSDSNVIRISDREAFEPPCSQCGAQPILVHRILDPQPALRFACTSASAASKSGPPIQSKSATAAKREASSWRFGK